MDKNKREVFSFQKIEDVPEAFKDKRFKGGTSALGAIVSQFLKNGRKDLAVAIWQYAYAHWNNIRKLPGGPARAKALHEWTDKAVEHHFDAIPQDKAQLSCRKGCSGCCYQEVIITDDEAILLSKKIKAGLAIDRDRLKKQAKLKDPDQWMPIPKETRKCVFLGDDNLCRVYEERPIGCRKYFVTSDPKICHDIRAENVRIYFINALEAFASAALNLKPKSGPMASMLLERLP